MLAESFDRRVSSRGMQPCLHARVGGAWAAYTVADVDRAIGALSHWLVDQHLVLGDRVLIQMENRPEWAVVAFACARLGLALVPVYTTHQRADIEYLIDATEPKACVTSVHMGSVIQEVTGARTIPCLTVEVQSETLFPSLDAPTEVDYPEVSGAAIYALIATSGTHGQPKIVTLTHQNIAANVASVLDVLREADLNRPQRFLSFLPLAHAYEFMAGLHLPFATESEIFYCDSLDRLASEMQTVRPTLMTAVPRLYELLYTRITQQVAKASGVQRWLFQETLRLGAQSPAERSLKDRMLNALCERLVRTKVRQRFGGELLYFVSGGAALNPEIAKFFTSLGVGILQGYGQTEASPVISVNRPGAVRLDTVGPPLSGVEVALSDAGELKVRGELVMQGYWKNPEATAQTIIDGWLHTGDLAEIDADGHIRIVGRLKDLIINSGGENIAPAPLEQALGFEPEIEQVVVTGDGRPWLAALIYPSESVREGSESADDAIRQAVKRVNASLSVHQHIRKWVVIDEPATLENGLLTPTQKVKRHALIARHQAALDALYHS